MVKGWRNDPRWVAHYARRDRERAQREIDRVKAEVAISMENADEQMANMKPARPRFSGSTFS